MDHQFQTSGRPDPLNPAATPAGTNGQPEANGITGGLPEAAPEPPPTAPPLTPVGWLSQNGPYLAIFFALIAWLFFKTGADGVYRAVLVALGLGFVIFLHELGHFATAKWCDVHVKTFSIGFGPALPGCSWQRGETTYKISILPLGGFVQMVGEGGDGDEEEDDPRSFKNKTVGQRMLIISAGVVMNILLGAICFVAVYELHGVPRLPAAVDRIDPGSPAWQRGVHTGSIITKLGDITAPAFNDLRIEVALKGRSAPSIPFTLVRKVHGKEETEIVDLNPKPRDENTKMPAIGVSPPHGVKLVKKAPNGPWEIPADRDSAAAAARVLDLKRGDTLVEATNPGDKNGKLTPVDSFAELCGRMRRMVGEPITLIVVRKETGAREELIVPAEGFDFEDAVFATTNPETPEEPFNLKVLDPAPPQLVGHTANEDRCPFDLDRRMMQLAARPIVLQVKRGPDSKLVTILVPPAYHKTVPLRMKMGKVAAIRDNSPAVDKIKPGDVISQWALVERGQNAPAKGAAVTDFDPVKLPYDLWTALKDKNGAWNVALKVLRPSDAANGVAVVLPDWIVLSWDDEWATNHETPVTRFSPMSIPELGIAYYVESTVEAVTDPKAVGPIQAGDVIEEIRFRELTKKGENEEWSSWARLQSKREGEKVYDEWACVFHLYLQSLEVPQFEVRVSHSQKRLDDAVRLELTEDKSWPLAYRGLHFQDVMKLLKADSLPQALQFGWKDTVSSIKQIYLTLARLISGDVSTEMLGGPIEIASQTFTAAQDPWLLILFLGMISVNLAVLNFLPIPILDGGHMVFLIYEKLRGKPPSEGVRAAATWFGLLIILGLMAFVFYLDIKRRFFGGGL